MKKRLLFSIILGSVITMLLQSCGCPSHHCIEAFTVLQSNQFPLAANDQWVYQRTDNNTNVVDTVTFTITSAAAFGTDSTVYKSRYTVGNTVLDSGTILQTATYCLYRPVTTQSFAEYQKLVFPIKSFGIWQNYYPGDTNSVITILTTKAELNQTFDNVFDVSRLYLTPGYAVQNSVYISPSIGIVEEDIIITAQQNTSNKTLRLINYTLH